jgi:hypothetical protein
MLHMDSESEVIRKLRYQVDNWDEEQEHLKGPERSSNRMDPSLHQHVQLCSPDTNCITISAYSVTIYQEHGITDFLGPLSFFFKRHNLNPDVQSYKVGLILSDLSHMLTKQITPYHSCRVTYDCQENGSKQTDLFRATSCWRKEGPRYDCVLVQGWPRSSIFFARVLGLFSASLYDKTHSLAILRPFIRKNRNKLTGFIELEEEGQEKYEFCFVDSFIRAVHIIPPTPTSNRSTVQDLVDGDSYLRFIGMN